LLARPRRLRRGMHTAPGTAPPVALLARALPVQAHSRRFPARNGSRHRPALAASLFTRCRRNRKIERLSG